LENKINGVIMKKICLSCILLLGLSATYADDETLINQYQFNQIISTYEIGQATNDINKNNITRVQIIYQQSSYSTALQIKNLIQQQTSKNFPIDLTSNNVTFALLNAYQPGPVVVNIYGNTAQGTEPAKNQAAGSFYGYTTQEKGFYYESNDGDD
jgi:hypothetical protein